MRLTITLQNGIYTIHSRDGETRARSLESALARHFERFTDKGHPPAEAFWFASEVLGPMIPDRGHGTVHEGVASA